MYSMVFTRVSDIKDLSVLIILMLRHDEGDLAPQERKRRKAAGESTLRLDRDLKRIEAADIRSNIN